MSAAALLVAACSPAVVETAPSTTAASTTAATIATTTTQRECRVEPEMTIFTGTDPVMLSLALSQATLACSDKVVVASGTPDQLAAAASFAADQGAPLLVATAEDDLGRELARLAPESITVIGDVLPNGIPPGVETTTLAALPPASSPSPSAGNGAIWLADRTRPDLAAPVMATAAMRGDEVVGADPFDLLGDPDLRLRLQVAGNAEIFVAGGFDPEIVEWQVGALANAPDLPGGGLKLFPGRRLVALYGNPTTSALGVLGEQGPEESVARAIEISAGYEADGTPILPAFEMIATVASAGPSADGNYSEEMSLDTLRPWIEVAGQNGVYVILDLQPGRTDFLTQAQIYEEFLRLPYVGLALDPEWRLKPDQVHLRQIGSVEAAEVNQVSQWLADLVRANNLPQKFFLLHQFRLDMIDNRDQIETHPELATVIQMDGQGPLGTKYETWSALTAGTAGNGLYWGWKNFYDEDSPRGGATPAEVLALDPVPVYVSYQ